MQRIVAELYDEVLTGVVVDGVPVDEGCGDLDLECEFTVRCEDGGLFKVHGWAVAVTVLES